MGTDNRFRPGRRDGRFVTTAGFLHCRFKHLQPALAFDPAFSSAQFTAWQRQVRRRLRALLAFPKVPPQPAARRIRAEARAGYTLERWELYPEPDSVVPVLLLVPDGASAAAPAPAVLCCPGSTQPKESLAGEPCSADWKDPFDQQNRMAQHLVRAGFVAVAMDNPAMGELSDRRAPDWRRLSHELIWLGRTYEGLSVFQKLVALRWLEQLPCVDPCRLAACGHSLGAKPALLLGVLDRAIRAVIWNDAATDWRVRHVVLNLQPVAPWHYIPGFLQAFDYPDLMAALAPTPLLVTEGGRYETHRRIRCAYALAGAPRGFRVTYMPNFATAAQRTHARRRLPEGLTAAEYARYCSYDGDHYFKHAVAVPWLCRRLSLPAQRAAR